VSDGPEFSPLPPDAPTEDRIGTAVQAMAAGTAAAVAWLAVLTFVQTRFLAASTATSVGELDPHSFDVNFMAFGIVVGMAFAGCTTWFLMASIPSSYRRGGLSMVAAFAGTVLGGLLTLPGHEHPAWLPALAVLAGVVSAWFGRRAIRSWK
jgi:hypothetical protein